MHRSRIRSFFGAAVALALAVGLSDAPAADPPAAGAQWVFIGTYTGGKDASKGIYRCRFDPATGSLSEPELAAEVVNPTFLAVHPSKKYLYAVGEVAAVNGKKGGGIHAFGLDAATGKLTPLNSATSVGAGPCHVAVNAAGTLLSAANYGGGSTVVYKLDPDGKLGAQAGFVQHTGAGGDAKGTHAHCGAFDPTGRFLMTVDLGLDKVKVFAIDPATGAVDDAAAADIDLPPKSGPRHIAFAPDGPVAYVCGERDSTVNVVFLDLAGGKSKTVQSLSTLPMPVPGNSTAEVVRHPNGKWVYVSNRGHNSIAVFAVQPDGKLEAAGHITGDIKIPRNFNVDPTGRWMLIASQDGGKVGVWELDPTRSPSGKETGRSVKVSRPVCIKFVAVGQ